MKEYHNKVYDYTGPDGTVSYQYRRYIRTDHYAFEVLSGDRFRVIRNGKEKIVKIEKDSSYVFRLMKSKLKAADGAQGFYKFLCENIDEDFAIGPWVLRPLDYIMDTMKPCA